MAEMGREFEMLLSEAISRGIGPLTAARSLRKCTRAELARMAGLTASEIVNVESGTAPIGQYADRLAQALGLPAAVLVAWS